MNNNLSISFISKFSRWVPIVALAMSLQGCDFNSVLLLEPSGPIAGTINQLFWITMALMTLVLIPVFGMTGWFIWKYRASNAQAEYAPLWGAPHRVEWIVWLFPTAIITILGTLTWIYTHRLDPYKPLESATPPLEVQVIAMDWKWLFVYPEQHIAAVNQLVIPVGRPISFKITSNTVMNSFFIPNLGGQIYAMAGTETQLHLLAKDPGYFLGENTQYSGRGFPFQNFEVTATTPEEFTSWVKTTQLTANTLDMNSFDRLAKPSINDPVIYYSAVNPNLFQNVLKRFNGEAIHPPMTTTE
ncbi:ubiquinol oxidase subunit II [Methylomarinum vadi]|uniref:ubiquinol oxidase subunit II n=1 Tax=Methylomarinum vadi TaxID=438855 RepID=UPI00056B6232|nr:ubiquinol oxidase subunit II [Methylomarinum vadi]